MAKPLHRRLNAELIEIIEGEGWHDLRNEVEVLRERMELAGIDLEPGQIELRVLARVGELESVRWQDGRHRAATGGDITAVGWPRRYG